MIISLSCQVVELACHPSGYSPCKQSIVQANVQDGADNIVVDDIVEDCQDQESNSNNENSEIEY